MAESEKSVTWVIAAVMIAIAVFGWGFLAGSYAGAHAQKMSELSEDELQDIDARGPAAARRAAKGRFIGNAIEQLPNLPAVISWHFSNRIWLPLLIFILEVLAFVGGIKMRSLEKELSKPRGARR